MEPTHDHAYRTRSNGGRTSGNTLRLVTWNANMALHRKLPELVERLAPDVAIVSECANEEILRRKGGSALPEYTMDWVGRLKDKGLAVFGFGDFKVSRAVCFDDRLQWVLPIEVQGPVDIALLAVWASNGRGRIQHPDHVGVPQSASSLTVYRDWIRGRPAVLAGDFNHNAIWDKPGTEWRNHATTVKTAAEAGLSSAYHTWFDEAEGCETRPTHYWRDRKIDGPSYHIDYVFVPTQWLPAVLDVQVGSFADWIGSGLSDHVPLVVDIDLDKIPTTSRSDDPARDY